MLKVNQEDPYNINFKKGSSATDDVQKLIVDGREVWNKPYEVSERVSVTTGTTGIKEADGKTWYSGTASIDIGLYRKKVSLKVISLVAKGSARYNETTGIVSISVKDTTSKSKVLCTLTYWT